MSELTLLFDSACPLCAAEMRRLARWDRCQKLGYIDIRSATFDAKTLGLRFEDVDQQLHARTANGAWLIGIDAITAAYELVGKAYLIWPLKIRLLRPLWQNSYRLFARHRNRISRWLGYGCSSTYCQNRY